MHAPKLKTWTTTAPTSAVFDSLLGVVQAGKYTIFALSNEQHKLLFSSGKTALSWGQEYVAEVREVDGRTQLEVVSGGHDGAPKALMDGWKNGRAADKVIAAVTAAVEGSTPAPATPAASFATTPSGATVPWSGDDLPTDG